MKVEIVESLGRFDDAALEHVVQGSNVFFQLTWLRMLEAVPLHTVLRGAVSFRYAVVLRDDQVLALCPFLLLDGREHYLAYSFEKTFFTSWQDELRRISPQMGPYIPWLSHAANGYRKLLSITGLQTDRCLLVASPMSYRASIAVAPVPESEREQAVQLIIDTFKALCVKEKRFLWFFRVPEEEAWLRSVLERNSVELHFMLPDTVVEDLSGTFDDYLRRFDSRKRNSLRKEIKWAEAAGIQMEWTRSIHGLEDELTRLYRQTYAKYGDEQFADHPPWFWSQAAEVREAEFLLARQNHRLVGFALFLFKQDLWGFRIGLEAQEKLYFNLAMYEPIRRALALGAKRYWVGSGVWGAKLRRGAVMHRLYNGFWFPRVAARALALPFLRMYSKMSERQFFSSPAEEENR